MAEPVYPDKGGGIAGSNHGILMDCHTEYYYSESKYAGKIASNNENEITLCTWKGNEKRKRRL